MPEGIEGLLEVLRRRAVRRPEHRLVARLSQTRDRLFPRLGADRVIREALDMLGEPVVAVLLDGFEDPRVELPSSRLEQTRVGDLVRQRVLEGVLDVGEEASLIEELDAPQVCEPSSERVLFQAGRGLKEDEGDVLADHGRGLQEAFLLRRQSVDPGGEHGLNRRRDLDVLERLREPMRAAPAGEHVCLDERPHVLLEEERIAIRSLDEKALERIEARISPEEMVKELISACGRERIDPQLTVVGLPAPGMPVLRAVIHEQHHARRRQALHEPFQHGLGLAVDPVEVLEDHDERLHLALTKEQALDSFHRPLTPLGWVEPRPRLVGHRHIEQREQGRHGWLQRAIERQHLADDLLLDLSCVITRLDLEVHAQEADDREIGRRLSVRDARGFQDETAVDAMRARELPGQA